MTPTPNPQTEIKVKVPENIKASVRRELANNQSQAASQVAMSIAEAVLREIATNPPAPTSDQQDDLYLSASGVTSGIATGWMRRAFLAPPPEPPSKRGQVRAVIEDFADRAFVPSNLSREQFVDKIMAVFEEEKV